MVIVRAFIVFLSCFILLGILALSSVTWSFLESCMTSFSFIKLASDNRARDIVVSLAKASENPNFPKIPGDLSKSFSRLKEITSKDSDGFQVIEIALVDKNGKILASSEEKPNPEKFQSDLYTSAYRMRKWEYPDPILLKSSEEANPSQDGYFSFLWPLIKKFFPEASETKALVSSAVYHTGKLDVVGAVHFIYYRGNYLKFIEKQKELYLWMVGTYSLITLGVSLLVSIIYGILYYIQMPSKNRSTKKLPWEEPDPPIVERIKEKMHVPNSEVVIPHSYATKVFKTPPVEPSLQTQNKENLIQPILAESNSKAIVVDAIYVGDYGD